MDEIDFEKAERLARAEIESGINRVRNRKDLPPENWNRKTCSICDDVIEAGRLALGKHTCLTCQREIELRQRQTAYLR